MGGVLPPLRVFEITETRTVTVKADDPLTAQMVAAQAFQAGEEVSGARQMTLGPPRFIDGRIRETTEQRARAISQLHDTQDRIRRVREGGE